MKDEIRNIEINRSFQTKPTIQKQYVETLENNTLRLKRLRIK